MTQKPDPAGAKVDEAAVAAQQRLHASHAKVCPIMSIGGQRFAGGLLTGLGERAASQQEAEVVACVGPQCMFFVITDQDQAGRPSGGGCALALIPSAAIAVNATLKQGLQAVLPPPTDPSNKA